MFARMCASHFLWGVAGFKGVCFFKATPSLSCLPHPRWPSPYASSPPLVAYSHLQGKFRAQLAGRWLGDFDTAADASRIYRPLTHTCMCTRALRIRAACTCWHCYVGRLPARRGAYPPPPRLVFSARVLMCLAGIPMPPKPSPVPLEQAGFECDPGPHPGSNLCRNSNPIRLRIERFGAPSPPRPHT